MLWLLVFVKKCLGGGDLIFRIMDFSVMSSVTHPCFPALYWLIHLCFCLTRKLMEEYQLHTDFTVISVSF